MAVSRLHVTNTITAKPECIDEVRKALKELLAPSLLEPGCLRFELVQSMEDRQVFVCLQVWKDLESHRAHLASEHVLLGIDQVPKLLSSEFSIRRYQEVE